MISVTIFINNKPIYTRSAVNRSEVYGKGMQTYEVDDGSVIKHKYEAGAVALAKKLLDTIKESK